MNSFSLVLVAAGSSRRMGQDKLLISLSGATVIARSLSAFFESPQITQYIVVTSTETIASEARAVAALYGKKVVIVEGGGSRAESVQNGLSAVKTPYVLVHDGARPFVSTSLITRVLTDTIQFGSAVPAIAMYDSIRVGENGVFTGVENRESFYRVQTPQGFLTEEIIKAYSLTTDETDESAALLKLGVCPHITVGAEENRKLTRVEDVFGLSGTVGTGYDVHRLVEGRKLMLGGVEVPSTFGEEAHSDGDVLLHAVMDAVLSAVGERDIGNLFSDKDPQYKDISSVLLLKGVMKRVAEKGRIVTGISAVVALGAPKLAPHLARIIENIKKETGAGFVNISATTTEGLGIIGAGGIAAYAVVTLL